MCRKDLCWSVRIVYVLDKLPDVSGPSLGEAGRYRMVSELTLAVSRTRTPACARARGRSVHGHLGCAVGTRRTDVAQGPLALDARMWHMGPLALDVWDVAKRGDPGGI